MLLCDEFEERLFAERGLAADLSDLAVHSILGSDRLTVVRNRRTTAKEGLRSILDADVLGAVKRNRPHQGHSMQRGPELRVAA